ncbi:MAG: efflux RND transporter periplasmic adaptor subunit [Candidatus Nitronauta litoralis]|uniref:Efflux RND transporter periplasmic adaptor subunit n=1 Tax=Candidatus Nitronauta litoralis TaxID=2705533 RepID=A0A7T0BYK0_9BACT|nr:MAG: efflux RND transporter periplasmic adaptor subunit [Candidatus Nitronauta litoralis]
MKKKLWLGLLLLFIVAGALFVLSENEKPDSPPDISWKTTPVKFGTLKVKVTATGVVEPNFEVEVKSKASGEVLEFPFEEGDTVKKDQLLLKLDKSDEDRNVARAQAELDSAMAKLRRAEITLLLQKSKYKTDLKTAESRVEESIANLKEAKDKLERQRNLFKEKIVAQESLDIAETSFKVSQESLIQARALLMVAKDSIHDITVKENEIELAKADVTQAEITLAEAQERLSETDIYAPISGTLIEKLVEQGQIISSGISNVSGGTPLSKVADLSRIFIIADVDETDIGSVRVGHPVSITTDAFQGKTFKGRVTRIAPKGVVENSITLFKVKIEILGKGRKILKPMMSANVDIISKELENSLFLPREAVQDKDGRSFVAILEAGLPKEVTVETGILNPIHIEIKKGVSKDQEVLVGDWEKLLEEYKKNSGKMSTMKRILFILSRK